MYFLTQFFIPLLGKLFWPLLILLAGALIGLAVKLIGG
jgi:hypothetical protein